MNQSRVALAAIATLIPLAMIATAYSGRPALQDRQQQEKITVVASFYPLYEFASRVVGDRAEVSSLVPAGVEPHDWEPTAEDVSRARIADVLVINGAGFEIWADDMETKVVANTSEGIEFNYKEENEAGTDEHGHEGDAATGGNGVNPHIWLDPMLVKHQIDKIRDALTRSDPANADYYNQNAARFTTELNSLDAFIRSELASCEKLDFIAFHDAFIHFSERYGLRQHSIQGVSPEGEILPQTIQQIIELANELDTNVIYSEDLIDSRLADTIANEIPDGKVLVLSPIEGIGEEEQAAGIGYIDKMKQNIANLKEGLECR
ncbi:MAG: zinc ABC transporter substrate-binding protein [Thermoproteota archaeon]|nr:zinc ABC transporter substrate-binding protein [Thermoproteota archaeon]